MSSAARPVDLTKIPPVPWAWVDEHIYAAIRGCSVKVLQRERRLNSIRTTKPLGGQAREAAQRAGVRRSAWLAGRLRRPGRMSER